MTGEGDAPLILSAVLDDASQAWFEAQRQRHFPPDRNFIAAHVTLFHHLPGRQQIAIDGHVAAACRAQPPARFTTTGLRTLGRGTAYTLEMPAVAALRQRLAGTWQTWLTAQDRQGWRPHVTIQNKVTPAEAKRLHGALLASFAPADGAVTGLALWRYCGGPWEAVRHYAFAGNGQTLYHQKLSDIERGSPA